MADFDSAHSGWKIAPQKYLETRPAHYSLPAVPESKYLTMRDGCRIAVDVYVPRGGAPGQKFPTVAIFTPYNRRFKMLEKGVEPSPNGAKYRDFFVPRGYAVVIIDCRGTGASFGTRDSLRSPKERDDSYEVAEWIVSQNWSDGVIGSTGISYLGAAACFLASTGHKAVKAIAPLFAVSDIYSEQLFPGGLLSRVWSQDYDELMLALDHADQEKTSKFPYFNDQRLSGPQPVDEDVDGSLLKQAIAEHKNNFRLHDMMPDIAFRNEGPVYEPTLNSDVCSPFYYQLEGTKKDVAIYSISGWYDGGGYANGAISRFLTMAGPKDRLMLGPWDHGARTNVSPFRDQTAAQFAVLGEVLRFFDEHLMGIDTGIKEESPIHYYSMHGNRWHEANVWPPVQPENHFLSADGTIQSTAASDETLVPYQVRFDTSTGKDTRWERLGALNIENYYFDWHGRDKLLLNFDSDVLSSDRELSGHIVAALKVASSRPDAALFVYAAEIEADGTARYITEGMLRGLHRATAPSPPEYKTTWPYRTFNRSASSLLNPGKVEEFEFALLPVSWTLKKGSKLRISVAGADIDHFPQVPNGQPPLLHVVAGGDNASFVQIPWRAVP